MIVGIVLGAVALILLTLLILCRRRFKRSKTGPPTTFHRDMMVRGKSDSPSDPSTLQDSRVFKLDSVTTGIGLIPEKTSVPTGRRSFSARSSPSLDEDDDDNEKTPSLTHFPYLSQPNLNTKGELTVPVPVSPTATSIYTSYTQSSDTPYTAIPRPKIPARTDRQMQIQEEIMDLRRQMIGTFESRSGPNDELEMLRGRISQLEKLQESDWALELSDIRPPGLGVAR